MKKIIVTGGLGFIGSNLIDLLIKKNFFVINIDKGTYSSNLYNIREYKNSRKYSAERSAQYRARRLAKKAREERRQMEKESIDALNHQMSHLTAVSGSDIVKSIQLNNIDNKEE